MQFRSPYMTASNIAIAVPMKHRRSHQHVTSPLQKDPSTLFHTHVSVPLVGHSLATLKSHAEADDVNNVTEWNVSVTVNL